MDNDADNRIWNAIGGNYSRGIPWFVATGCSWRRILTCSNTPVLMPSIAYGPSKGQYLILGEDDARLIVRAREILFHFVKMMEVHEQTLANQSSVSGLNRTKASLVERCRLLVRELIGSFEAAKLTIRLKEPSISSADYSLSGVPSGAWFFESVSDGIVGIRNESGKPILYPISSKSDGHPDLGGSQEMTDLIAGLPTLIVNLLRMVYLSEIDSDPMEENCLNSLIEARDLCYQICHVDGVDRAFEHIKKEFSELEDV